MAVIPADGMGAGIPVDQAERVAGHRAEGSQRQVPPRSRAGSDTVRSIGAARSPSESLSESRSAAGQARRPLSAGGGANAVAAAGAGANPVIDSQATTDAALITRVRDGDVAAYATVVHRHMRAAFGIAYHVLQHREDAEDVVQQAFMAALTRLDTFDVARPFAPWFGRVVLNHARSARRSRDRLWRRSAEPAELLETPPALAADRLAEDSEIRSRVHAAMSVLPERQRLAIQLIEIDGYTPAEVATMLDLAPVTMRWHLMAARRTLRRLLAPLAHARVSGGDDATSSLEPEVAGRAEGARTEPREARDVRGK
jgi:RNA polymerase sigma-70 factor (ECF subfamily)